MAVQFPASRETSSGPLDINKVGGGDNDGLIQDTVGSTDNLPLDSAFDEEAEAELLRKKNPLGYTITPPTEREIEDGVRQDERA